jgi:HK97 family phage portal protein
MKLSPLDLVKSLRRGKRQEPPKSAYTLIFTRGDELIHPADYKRGFEQELFRAVGGHAAIDDITLSRAYGASAAALACTEKSSNVAASFPLIAADPSDNPLVASPLSYFLKHQSGLIVKNSVTSLYIWGRNYLQKQYNSSGYPTGLKWINPVDVREMTDGQNRILYYDVLTPAYRYERVAVRDMLYMQLFDTRSNGRGLSKFEQAWRQLSIDFGLVTYAAAFLTNGAHPDGFLSFDVEVSDELFKQAQIDWKVFKGAANAHKTAVMPPGARWTSIQSVPEDLALTELKGIEREDICAIFEVDPMLVGLKGAADPLSANSTYSAAEINFIRNVMLPLMKLLILPALNTQWAHSDFDVDDYYTVKVDETAIPALAEANLVKAQTAQSLTDNNLLDYDEGRKILGYTSRTGYFIRTPEEALAVFESGGISYYEFREYTMGIEPGDDSTDMVMIGGQLFPRARLLELAHANADRIIQISQMPAPWTVQPPPTPPAPAQLPATTDEVRTDLNSLCIGLDLSNHPDLIALQGRVREFYRDAEVQWNAPDDFHITLLYAPAVDEAKMRQIWAQVRQLEMPTLDLVIGSLKTFDNLGNYALHFRLRRSAALLAFQSALYDMVIGQGVEVSAYSTPTTYTPHITMGYMSQRPRAVTFNSKIQVAPTQIIVWQDDDVMFRAPEQLPAPAALTVSRSHSYGQAGCTFIVSLDTNEALIASQILIKALMPDPEQAVRWIDPAGLHVTLVTASIMDDTMLDQVMAQLPALEAFDIEVGPLDTFDGDDEIVMIMRVESAALRTLQRQLYDLCVAAGATLDDYSDPAAYQPHVTVAYAQAGVQLPAFAETFPVNVTRIQVSRTDYQTIHQVEMVAPAVQRAAAASMRIAVSLANNQFVKYACRALATYLTGLEVVATWESESDWCLPLAQAETWSPAQAARLIRTADYADTRKLDVTAGGYQLRNGVIYLVCQSNDTLAALRTSIELDFQAIAQTTIAAPDVFGIPLCAVAEDVSLDGAPTTSYPLVANNLTLYKASRAEHQWTLRGVPPAQATELQRWERLIRRKGAGYDFKLEVLDGTDVAEFVRMALAAEVDVDDVFEIATGILRGFVTWRAYADTREDFVDAITDVLVAGQGDEIERRAFAAKFRAHLRRFGLVALRDGMNEVGYDPESFSPEQLAAFRGWQAEVSEYVTNLGKEVFGQGITENEIEIRVRMWADISLNAIRLIGIKQGNPEARLRWDMGQSEEHCDICPLLDGQVHTVTEWEESGFQPGNGRTPCKQGCNCTQTLTEEEVRGTLPTKG